MSEEIEVDLVATGGRLKFSEQPPKLKAEPESVKRATPEPVAQCKHCGQDPKSDPVTIDSQDVIDFQRSVWSGKKFTKEYKLFGETAAVTFRELTVKQRQAIKNKLMAEAATYAGTPADALVVYERANLFCLALSVAELRLGETITPFSSVENVDEALDKFTNVCVSDLIYQAVWDVFAKFQDLRDVIVKKAADPSFYTAVKPAGQ